MAPSWLPWGPHEGVHLNTISRSRSVVRQPDTKVLRPYVDAWLPARLRVTFKISTDFDRLMETQAWEEPRMSLQVNHLYLEDWCAGISSGHGDVHVPSHLADSGIFHHQHVKVNHGSRIVVGCVEVGVQVAEKLEKRR